MEVLSTHVDRFINIPFKKHLVIGIVIRLLLIVYSEHHDKVAEVRYTDVDYHVFTDAARHIWNGQSPYSRQTFRYSPLIAMLVVPNIVMFFSFGKLLFSLVDVFVAVLIHTIVFKSLNTNTKICNCGNKIRRSNTYYANFSMIFWLYNPMSIIIATRGNADSIAALLILSSLYLLDCKKYFWSGIIHGLACHLRIYPIVFSLAMYMHLSDYSDRNQIECSNVSNRQLVLTTNTKEMVESSNKKPNTIFKKKYIFYLIPNYNQLLLVIGSIMSLSLTIILFYWLYGYQFLYETYIYHVVRRDTRHNFSIYFYLQYLTADIKNMGIWHRILTFLPNLILLAVISIRYGLRTNCLYFSVFAQAVVLVAYNSVMTSQYFVWFLSILPVLFWQIHISKVEWLKLAVMWIAAQLAWLLPAYLLEFCGQNTFLFIWIQGVAFFSANIVILGRFIKYLSPVIPKLN